MHKNKNKFHFKTNIMVLPLNEYGTVNLLFSMVNNSVSNQSIGLWEKN